MWTSHKSLKGLAAALTFGALLAACGGVDMDVNAPILNAAGLNVKEALMGKPVPSPNLPERPPLVLPPPNAALPVPGQGTQTAINNQQWPKDPEDAKKKAAKEAAAKKEDYCKNGDWSGDHGNIDTFNKNANQDTRCRPTWMSRILGNGESQKSE